MLSPVPFGEGRETKTIIVFALLQVDIGDENELRELMGRGF